MQSHAETEVHAYMHAIVILIYYYFGTIAYILVCTFGNN